MKGTSQPRYWYRIGMRYPNIGIANMFIFATYSHVRYIGNICFLDNFLRVSGRSAVLKPLEKHNGNAK